MRGSAVIVISVLAAVTISWWSCGKKSSDDPAPNTTTTDGTGGDTDGTNNTDGGDTIQPGQIALTGIVSSSAGLQDGAKVTHVVAFETDTNESRVAEVGEDGKFTLPLEKDASFVITYIDNTKTGADMLVSTFGTGELDTIPTTDTATNIDLGSVNVSGETATAATSAEDLTAAMGVTADAAETWGAIDDASLRYSNPDIDGDGKIDAANNQKFPLDFHNRFNVVNKDGDLLAMKDLKNAFPPDDADVQFTGSGIIPWFDDSVYSTPLDKYTWKFSVDAVFNGSVGTPCNGLNAGDTLAANTECELTASSASSGGKYPSIELKAAVAGTYTLKAGGKTFTWPNVRVSDFSGGKDFLALFIRMDVDSSDKLTGLSYRWRIKKDDGTWRAATDEEIKLIISGGIGYVSLKVDGTSSGKELGIRIPPKSEGEIKFAEAEYATAGSGDPAKTASVMLPSTGLTEADVKGGLAWTRVLENPGISYDDKLGMRFFIGYSGSNN